MSEQDLKLGDIVQYNEPFEDEIGISYKIVEIDYHVDWCLLEAQIGEYLNPTSVANISGVHKI